MQLLLAKLRVVATIKWQTTMLSEDPQKMYQKVKLNKKDGVLIRR